MGDCVEIEAYLLANHYKTEVSVCSIRLNFDDSVTEFVRPERYQMAICQ